jgi:hypothetical protein
MLSFILSVLTENSCAAKYKSSKALHGDRTLFEQLTTIRIYTTDGMATHLVLTLGSSPLRVLSERIAIHSEISEGMIKIYVPSQPQQRRICYRSQLPNLLTNILGIGQSATFDISTIITSSIEELEDVLVEQDIPPVAWIDRPVIVVPYSPEDGRPTTPPASHAGSDSETLVPRSGLVTPDATPKYHRRAVPIPDAGYSAETTPPPQYPALIEQVVRSAQRTTRTHHNAEDIADQTPSADRIRDYDHYATFGSRKRNPFVHDRRIGAAGEGYVRSSSLPSLTLLTCNSGVRIAKPPQSARLYRNELAQHHPQRTFTLNALRKHSQLDRSRNSRYCVQGRLWAAHAVPS